MAHVCLGARRDTGRWWDPQRSYAHASGCVHGMQRLIVIRWHHGPHLAGGICRSDASREADDGSDVQSFATRVAPTEPERQKRSAQRRQLALGRIDPLALFALVVL